ncbi:alkaline shock response membrane anchor protein AmaP [Streptomyces sp. NPDC048636]|uniref:alkaline shock response membrane anchor protein AmaP n=1 Tax=Streptomyces sp. NPDC048636 TaxID=3155762 RepID=UPI003429A942
MTEPTKTNRVLLGLLGLLLLGGGLLVLASGADLYRRWNLTPPAGWPLTAPSDVLLARGDQNRWFDQGWWWWVAAAAALALLLLLALTWLLSQPRRRPRRLPVANTSRESVVVDDHALGEALTTELDVSPDVRRSRTRFFGPSSRPRVRIDLTLEPGGTPEHALKDVRDAADRARDSAGWDRLPKEVRLGVARHGPHRAE